MVKAIRGSRKLFYKKRNGQKRFYETRNNDVPRRDHEAIAIRGPVVFRGCVCIGNGIVCVYAVESAKINLENLITRTRTGPLRFLR